MTAAGQSQEGRLHILAETDKIAALRLEGEFDLGNSVEITEAGERLLADSKQVILDLSATTFIDCAVVRALSRLNRQARERGSVIVLQLGTAPIVERVIEITEIDRVLPRVKTRGAALDTIRRLRP